MRLSRGRSTPAIRAKLASFGKKFSAGKFAAWLCRYGQFLHTLTAYRLLTLSLLMLGIDADYAYDSLSLDDLALLANFLHRGANLHYRILPKTGRGKTKRFSLIC